MSTSSIVDLSARIAANTVKVSNYLAANGLPPPSFGENAPLQGLIPEDALEVQAARMAIIQDTMDLRRLMLGCTPRDYVMSFSVRHQIRTIPCYALRSSNRSVLKE